MAGGVFFAGDLAPGADVEAGLGASICAGAFATSRRRHATQRNSFRAPLSGCPEIVVLFLVAASAITRGPWLWRRGSGVLGAVSSFFSSVNKTASRVRGPLRPSVAGAKAFARRELTYDGRATARGSGFVRRHVRLLPPRFQISDLARAYPDFYH